MVSDDDVNLLLRDKSFSAAFELLLDRYRDKVFRLAISVLREGSRAEEVTQETFLKLWKALPAYDGRAALSTWLYTIARNTCLSAVRAESYRATLQLTDCAEPPVVETVSRNTEIKQLLERLPAIQRQIITLFYLQEGSVYEVAQLLGLPEGTVKSHLHRARRALAELMRK